MAITKILTIGDCGAGHSGKHLRQALGYITAPQKTGDGKWVGALNCQKEDAYNQMRQTKEAFGKTDKRQGYHMIISFVEGEVDTETAFEIIGRFAGEYLGKDYEALYAVHDNTEHIHGHVIFNSVSFRDGKKYRYEKGDWAEKIQPMVNRLCEEYGLSMVEISPDSTKEPEKYKEWNDTKSGGSIWKDMIRRDIDACVLQSPSYESFLSMLSGMGYAVKNAYEGDGKYLSVRPMGMARFKRCRSLGADYTRERIRERILTENLSQYQPEQKRAPGIVRCRVKRYQRAKMSGIQKRYFARLYRTGRLKKRPYSQAWKYRDDIRMMHRLQEDYLFLNRHRADSVSDIAATVNVLQERRKEASKEKSRIYKERARFKPLFDAADEMKGLQECEDCYSRGEDLFKEEHERWQELNASLLKEGYSLERLEALEQHFQNELLTARKKEKQAAGEARAAGRILKECMADSPLKEKEKNINNSLWSGREDLSRDGISNGNIPCSKRRGGI